MRSGFLLLRRDVQAPLMNALVEEGLWLEWERSTG